MPSKGSKLMATAETETERIDAGEAAPLEATLLTRLPDPLAVGAGTVLHLEGGCDPRTDPGSLNVSLGGVAARAEVEAGTAAGEGVDAGRRWWALLEIPAGALPDGPADLVLRGRIGARPVAASLARVAVMEFDTGLAPPPPSVVAPQGAALVAVCMATHEPDPDRLRAQVESIRGQDWPAWVCVISDDASSPEGIAAINELTADDERFLVSRSEGRLGFYRNFERALRIAPVEASYIALSDQDDVWDRDKLSALVGALESSPDAGLAYSDMRMVDERGEVISDTYWILRRNRWDSITSLLVANTVTGAASLFRRELLETALPFPPAVAEPYHDHWLALCALSLGELTYLDRPTYDRVRHLSSVTAGTGHARALLEMREGGTSVPAPGPSRATPREVHRESYLQLAQFARVLELRVGGRIAREKRRALRRFAAADRSLAATVALGLRSTRRWVGRNETLGRERALAAALLWRRFGSGSP